MRTGSSAAMFSSILCGKRTVWLGMYLGGYLIGQLGHIPEEGETIEMKLCGWLFSVELFEEKRILKVLATKLPEEEKEEAEAEEKADEE